MMQTKPPPTPDVVRVTVPVRADVLEAFQRLAKAGSTSTGRAMGDWLADTVEAVEFMAEKMEEARSAPKRVIRELHGYALGLADETGALIEEIRQKGRTARAQPEGPTSRGSRAAGASGGPSPRPVIRGGKSPKSRTPKA